MDQTRSIKKTPTLMQSKNAYDDDPHVNNKNLINSTISLTNITDDNRIVINNAEISYINQTNLFKPENNISNINNIDNRIEHDNISFLINDTSTMLVPSIKKISLKGENKFQTIHFEEEDFELYESFIEALLKPHDLKGNMVVDNKIVPKFRFRREHIIALTKACQEIVASQPIVLRINSPVKVFGDIHGQYDDLMRFFQLWGEPSEKQGIGDINAIDYLFLGDYVDRGVKSLETICLLMSLKIKYPDKIHLLRGNHEDNLINACFGFLDECEFRLSEDITEEDLNVFKTVNEFFEYLPLAAIIENQILCLHGGIGGCLTNISEIEEIERPLSVVHEVTNKTEQIVMDILWSDPTDNDEEKGIQPNLLRDSKSYGNIVKYGPDVVEKFLNNNGLSMIIRAHECVLDGFERFDGGHLITVFSATDYCRRHKNAGAMLVINNNFEIIPHLIYPINTNNVRWFDNEDTLKKRPPTPLRRRKKD